MHKLRQKELSVSGRRKAKGKKGRGKIEGCTRAQASKKVRPLHGCFSCTLKPAFMGVRSEIRREMRRERPRAESFMIREESDGVERTSQAGPPPRTGVLAEIAIICQSQSG